MIGRQVSYRPLRYSSHGVQMYRIPIHNKIRCTVKAQLSLGKNGSCVFVFVHTTFQKRRMSILCTTLSNKHFAKQNSICIDECPACVSCVPFTAQSFVLFADSDEPQRFLTRTVSFCQGKLVAKKKTLCYTVLKIIAKVGIS